MRRIALRWTIGDVSAHGFETLRLAVWGAYRIFGERAAYAVCVNCLPLATAKRKAGALPAICTWHEATPKLPACLRDHVDAHMAEGVAWKFAPLRLFMDRHEIAFDNDCVLWSMPPAIERWLDDDGGACLLAADVRAAYGGFAPDCGDAALNSGIRGFPPGFDAEAAIRDAIARRPIVLTSELDEQGLEVAALSAHAPPFVVALDDVSICSPFPPHLPYLGRCGAHFCGLNRKEVPWHVGGRPATDLLREHWARHRPAVHANVGVEEAREAL